MCMTMSAHRCSVLCIWCWPDAISAAALLMQNYQNHQCAANPPPPPPAWGLELTPPWVRRWGDMNLRADPTGACTDALQEVKVLVPSSSTELLPKDSGDSTLGLLSWEAATSSLKAATSSADPRQQQAAPQAEACAAEWSASGKPWNVVLQITISAHEGRGCVVQQRLAV